MEKSAFGIKSKQKETQKEMWSHGRPTNKWSLGESRSPAENLEKAEFKGYGCSIESTKRKQGCKEGEDWNTVGGHGCHSKKNEGK